MENFSLDLLTIRFTTTFAMHMQKFIVSTDSNHSCCSERTEILDGWWGEEETSGKSAKREELAMLAILPGYS